MPKYKLLKPWLYTRKVDGVPQPPRLYQAGEIVDFDGLPSAEFGPDGETVVSTLMEAQDKAGEAKLKEAAEIRRDERRKAAVNSDDRTKAITDAVIALLTKGIEKAGGSGKVKRTDDDDDDTGGGGRKPAKTEQAAKASHTR